MPKRNSGLEIRDRSFFSIIIPFLPVLFKGLKRGIADHVFHFAGILRGSGLIHARVIRNCASKVCFSLNILSHCHAPLLSAPGVLPCPLSHNRLT